MTPKQQEALFQRVREHFPEWSKQKCSGYLHGILDEAKYTRPEHRQVKAFSSKRSYAMGYVSGFVDARGPDAFNDPRLRRFKTCAIHPVDFCWWNDVE